MNLKTVLITLTIIAAVLMAITFYVVFYSNTGTYVISSLSGQDAGIFGPGVTSTVPSASETASSTPSSTLAFASDTASSSIGTGGGISTPNNGTPITWTQGNETLSVTDASVSGSQLTLGIQVTMGSISECVPLTVRLIADEQGDLSPPATSQFAFPDTGNCNGTAGETYSSQPIVFTLPNPGVFPILLTTGGNANILFEVVQNPDGSLTVQLPPSTD